MLRILWSTINDQNFLNTIKKLRENEVKLPVEAKYRLAVIGQACYFEMLRAQEEAKLLLKKYAKSDEKGGILGYPDPLKIEFETKELEEAHDSDFKEMLKRQFKIDSFPIAVGDLSEISLSGDELLAIKPILKDLIS